MVTSSILKSDSFRQLYPWAPHSFTQPSGFNMHYLDEGAGEPLLMLHGNPSWSFFWRSLVHGLSKQYRCIVPDHIGCGLSDKPDDSHYSYRLRQRVDDVDALVESLKLDDNVTLVLHDWGGMIGMAYALKRRHKIKRLVILNTAAFGLPREKKLPWQIDFVLRAPFSSLAVRGFNAFARGALRTCSVKPERMTQTVRDAYLAPYDSWANRIAIQRFVEDIPLKVADYSFDIVKNVADNVTLFRDTPTRIFWGDQDFVFDHTFLAAWQQALPNAQVTRFADAGHYVLEDAHELIVPQLTDFLAQHPLSSGPTQTISKSAFQA
jgi:cis-3-alkyl-4-acyloxetan-2-one decarboxylase